MLSESNRDFPLVLLSLAWLGSPCCFPLFLLGRGPCIWHYFFVLTLSRFQVVIAINKSDINKLPATGCSQCRPWSASFILLYGLGGTPKLPCIFQMCFVMLPAAFSGFFSCSVCDKMPQTQQQVHHCLQGLCVCVI